MERKLEPRDLHLFYSNPILRYLQNWGHLITESFLPKSGLIMDLGAGTGEHQNFSSLNETMVSLDQNFDLLKNGCLINRMNLPIQGTAQKLPFKKNVFDGIVSVYCFEHLTDLEICISEASRILKPNGILSLALPTEGFLFKVGRHFVTAPLAVKNLGFESIKDYENYVKKQHINSLEKIIELVKKWFIILEMKWFPFFISSPSVNFSVAIKAQKF